MTGKTRYIKTRVDGTATIIHMTKCNLCPFLMFYKENKTARCSRFYNKANNSNIIHDNIYSYSVTGMNSNPLQDLDIPYFCNLPKTVQDIHKENELYIRNGHNRYETIPNLTRCLMVYSSLFIKYDDRLNHLIFSNSSSKPITSLMVQKPLEETKPVIVKRECSCCGEDKENIHRDINSGMCSDCWVKYKENEEYKYFAFINNFRLKRRSTWTDVIPKKLKEIC